jgi:hypothetical protein
MSVERLLLAAWEEEGFVGKNRVAIGSADLEVLAINVNTQTVRIGESKIREGSQRVYVIDDWCATEMAPPEVDFEWWLTDLWSQWLKTLPKTWGDDGSPAVPWLPPLGQVRLIEVVFCCNLHLFTDRREEIDGALGRAAERHLGENGSLAARLKDGLRVQGKVQSTIDLVFDLTRRVCQRIDEGGYGRRSGDPFKDLVRELHRYLSADLVCVPKDERGEKLGTRKSNFQDEVRRQAVLGLLKSLGITEEEVVGWLGAE